MPDTRTAPENPHGSPGTGRAPLAIAGHPIYSMLLPVPILCFLGALVTDLVYASAPEMLWLDFSSWLLFTGLVGGAIALVVLVVELIRAGRGRTTALVAHGLLLLAAWVVEIFNSLIHARDGWTAVVPTGLLLSIIAASLALISGLFWQKARRAWAGDHR